MHEDGSQEHGHHSGVIVPVRTYVLTFIILLILTGATTGVAYINLGVFNTVVALVIAVMKMLLVILFFMHVKYQPGLTRIAIICAFFWLGIMMTLTLSDELTRGWEMNPAPWSALIPHIPHIARLLLF
ncbi:MAG TPA: cytochrome C oxidase subunit IV family protein [Candidatus Acidoferrales bacterium]|nr:cytochrome C oxidase subunit IV family protein [Candidatus Acidoferrales bacterium]